ncbi:MAG: ATP-binding protein [Thermodesulfobacteriota bacterium]
MLHIRSKTITAILLVILSVSLCYLYFFMRVQVENRRLLIDSKTMMVSTLVGALTEQADKLYGARIISMCQLRTGLVRSFAERDVESLREFVQPIFTVLQQENNHFDHINFVLPDNTILLRVQDPSQRSDTAEHLCQVTLGMPRDEMSFRSGFVYGDCGLLYRIMQPIHDQGRYIGNIIFGIRIGAFIENIAKVLGMHTALALRSDIVGDGAGKNAYAIRSGEYLLYPYDDVFFTEKGAKISYSGNDQEFHDQDGIHLVFPSFQIKDTKGAEIGSILQALEISAIESAAKRDVMRLILITVGVLLTASLILYLAFSSLYRQLMELNETLNEKNEELSKASHQLEEQVAARTAELAEANARLQDEIKLRREANLSLTRSIEEWQSTFDAITDPVTILDKNLEVVIANKAAQALLSQGEQEIVGRTCHELYAGSRERCPDCPAGTVFTQGITKVYEVEHQYLGKSLLVSCSAINDGQDVLGFVHTAKDITEEKGLKKQLAQAQKMEAIATLAGGIAHDFNNILGAILGNADLLLFRLTPKAADSEAKRPELTREDIESHIQAIKKAGNRAKDLVGQILAFSRQGKTQRQNAVITPAIKEAVKLLRSSLPANIDIRADLAQDLCPVYCDLTQIHQVFMNLCTNAAQAMAEKGGILAVTLKNFEAGVEDRQRYPHLKAGRYVLMAVEDTGHGMSPEVMDRIFDPFFTTRDVGVGTGMGLAVIHGIISAHDGILDVKSEVDKGSVFSVFFPCVPVSGEASQDIILGMPRGNEKILFVDDEEDIVRMSSRMLEYLGYTVYPATSGEQALALLGRENFSIDLLITDYSMPKMSGVQLAREVLRLRPALPIMLCSGFSESVIEEDVKKLISRFMSKPLDMKKLAVAIREILASRPGE